MSARPVLGVLPSKRPRPGQPIAVLLTVVAVWVVARIGFGHLPFEPRAPGGGVAEAGEARTYRAVERGMAPRAAQPPDARTNTLALKGRTDRHRFAGVGPRREASPVAQISANRATTRLETGRGSRSGPLADFARKRVGAQPPDDGRPAAAPSPASKPDSPLSLNAWLFLREGGSSARTAFPLAANYGRSQAGAVLRYRLDRESRHEPSVYARASLALDTNETDAALGATIRPVPAIPLHLHAEMRLTRTDNGSELRPSAFATAGFEGVALPFDSSARGYVQAGYVGGEFATGFVDGQVVADRELVALSQDSSVSLGGGVWGGAQDGAGRLDIGPSMRVDLRVAGTPVRLAADYRFRVAGEARPGSGAALTLSTAF